MPVVARFVIDFLGFWDSDVVKDAEGKEDIGRKSPDPNFVYEQLNNCQDYLTYNSDETTVLPRRIEFRKSIQWLYDHANYGIQQVQSKKRQSNNPKNLTEELQQFGTAMATALLSRDFTAEEAAAIRLSIALDAVHKSILMVCEMNRIPEQTNTSQFAEVLDYLLHKTIGQKYIWEDVQQLSSRNADADLRGYVLETQRLAVKVPLIRQIPDDVSSPGQFPIVDDGSSETKFESGDVLLLHTVNFSFSICNSLSL
jgi:hypothetical protein